MTLDYLWKRTYDDDYMKSRRSRLGLMEIEDAVHCVYMAEGLKRCPTCGEDLTFEEKKSVLL